jgi:23S rRNA (adenine2503-C2)-methyltransferase
MGKLRDLSTDEILIQLYFANKVVRVFQTLLANKQQVVSSLPPLPHVDNVVFMGMGDASDNALAVLEATSIMTHQRLFGLAQSKVTISTVAPSPQAFLQLGQAPAILAWSVHAVRDSLRKQLVPTTQYTMVELRQGLIQALLQRPTKLQTTMWQITLIDQVNDSPIEAEELANFALEMIHSVPRIKLILNLIPFNDIGHAKYRKPSIERIRHFQKILMERGLVSFIRTTRGDDESAACGQLATKKPKLSSPLP